MKHVKELHTEFVNEIRPILQAKGRNNVYKVAQFISRNLRSDISDFEVARRIISTCSKSRSMALQIWINDLKRMNKDQVIDDVIKVVQFYKKRKELNDIEKCIYEKLRKEEVTNSFGGDIA